jgi:hypothetical protein
MVRGEYTSLESELTGFILRLGDSRLLGSVTLAGKEVQTLKNSQGDVLVFTLSMEIL